MIINSARANKVCSQVRKDFNLCRSNILGKLVEPQYCETKAAKVIDCFQNVRRDSQNGGLKSAYDKVFNCGIKNSGAFGGSCDDQLKAYVNM